MQDGSQVPQVGVLGEGAREVSTLMQLEGVEVQKEVARSQDVVPDGELVEG